MLSRIIQEWQSIIRDIKGLFTSNAITGGFHVITCNKRSISLSVVFPLLVITIAGCSNRTLTWATTTSTSSASHATSTAPTPRTTNSAPVSATSPTSASTSTVAPAPPHPTNSSGVPLPATTQGLAFRDCYNTGDDSQAVVVDCADPHDGQVFQTDVALSGLNHLDTGVTQWLAAAAPKCQQSFPTFVGYAMPEIPGIPTPTSPSIHGINPPTVPSLPSFKEFQFTIVITSPAGATPVVACAVVRNGTYSTPKITPTTGEDGRPGFTLSDERSNKWTGSAEDTTGSYAGITVGDCFDFPTSIAAATELSCDQPHEAEMFVLDKDLGISDLAAPYPTEDEWSQIATPICEDQFTEYTAIPMTEASGLSYTFIYPLKKDWRDLHQRILSCAIVADDETKLVGTRHA